MAQISAYLWGLGQSAAGTELLRKVQEGQRWPKAQEEQWVHERQVSLAL